MKKLFAFFIFIFSSFYVLFLDHLAMSSRALQRGLVFLIVVFMIVLYHLNKTGWKDLFTTHMRWLFLFWGTVFVQTLVLSTGGISSPFLILIHLFMITISFLYNFHEALLFLILSFFVILFDKYLTHNLLSFLLEDPGLVALQLVALTSIVPIAYIISKQYHMKEMLYKVLNAKVATDKAIIENLNELVIVTDKNHKILSVNEAVLRATQKSRSELLGKLLFEALLLKNHNGNLLSAENLYSDKKKYSINKNSTEGLILINSSIPQKRFKLLIQPIKNLQSKTNQVSFIFSYVDSQELNTSPDLQTIVGKARSRYEALVQDIKESTSLNQTSDIKNQIILLDKIESDIYSAQTLISSKINTQRIDIAKLCEQIVLLEREFALALNVGLKFNIRNFGAKDIERFTVKNFPVKPSQFTGPFFTAHCDSEKFETIIKKLIEINIMLCSRTNSPEVSVEIEQKWENRLIVKISGQCPNLEKVKLTDLFTPYYGKNSGITSLNIGSGLEGFLAKSLCDNLSIDLQFDYLNKPESKISFILELDK